MEAPSLNCRGLVSALNGLCDGRERRECNELLAALYVIKNHGPLGRHGLARVLGVSERRARTILDKLRDRGLIVVHRVAGAEVRRGPLYTLLDMLECSMAGGWTRASIGPAEPEIIEFLDHRVLAVRDEIVLTLGEPGLLELIGYWREGEMKAPGMPGELLEKYRRLLGDKGYPAGTVTALYRGYCIYCCTALLYALYMLCKRYSSTSDEAKRASQS